MKGYYISVKNDLLDPKHRKKMGSAVWEFMWLLDHITSIDENGDGHVLGKSPVKARRIQHDLGIGRASVSENLTRLERERYISMKRTPYGYIFTVHKASKPFNQKQKEIPEKRNLQIPEKRNQIPENRNVIKTIPVLQSHKQSQRGSASKEAGIRVERPMTHIGIILKDHFKDLTHQT